MDSTAEQIKQIEQAYRKVAAKVKRDSAAFDKLHAAWWKAGIALLMVHGLMQRSEGMEADHYLSARLEEERGRAERAMGAFQATVTEINSKKKGRPRRRRQP